MESGNYIKYKRKQTWRNDMQFVQTLWKVEDKENLIPVPK